MVVNDLDAVCVSVMPHKTQPILVVNSYAVLAFAMACQRLKMVAAGYRQIGKAGGPMEDGQFLECGGAEARGNAATFAGFPKKLRVVVFEALNHER
jgi:hypothetical protein